MTDRASTSLPAGDGYGQLEVYVSEWPRTIKIQRADPRIRLPVRLVAQLRDIRCEWAHCTEDGVLTLTDDHGARYIYRVDLEAYDTATESFPAEWPD